MSLLSQWQTAHATILRKRLTGNSCLKLITRFMTENRSHDYIQGECQLGHFTPRWTLKLITRFMTENRSYDYIQGECQLGHFTPCWTCLIMVDTDLLKWGYFFIEMALSLQMSELWRGQCQVNLGHVTSHWTHLMIVGVFHQNCDLSSNKGVTAKVACSYIVHGTKFCGFGF